MGGKPRSWPLTKDPVVAELLKRGEESKIRSRAIKEQLDVLVAKLCKQYPGCEKELMYQLEGQYQGLMREIETKKRRLK